MGKLSEWDEPTTVRPPAQPRTATRVGMAPTRPPDPRPHGVRPGWQGAEHVRAVTRMIARLDYATAMAAAESELQCPVRQVVQGWRDEVARAEAHLDAFEQLMMRGKDVWR